MEAFASSSSKEYVGPVSDLVLRLLKCTTPVLLTSPSDHFGVINNLFLGRCLLPRLFLLSRSPLLDEVLSICGLLAGSSFSESRLVARFVE